MAAFALAPWSVDELTSLRRFARLMGPTFDLPRLAMKLRRPATDVNLALDALIARTPDEAAAILRARRPPVRGAGALTRFLKEMFG